MSTDQHPGIAERVFGYRPNDALAIIGAVVYATATVALLYRVLKSKAWWGSCLPIGAFFEALGFLLRYLSRFNRDSLGLFAVEQLCIVCAPAAFLAFNYITYGRLIASAGAEHSIVNPQKVAKIFVTSDIFTFLLQAGGSGLQTAASLTKTGQRITLIGLTIQAVSYGFFCILLVKSHISIKSSGASPLQKSSIALVYVLYFSSAFICIRCIYRVAEYAQGYGGYLITHEAFLYTLDTLPLVLAIAIYIPYWPSKYIKQDNGYTETVEMNEGLRA